MSIEKVRTALAALGLSERIREFEVSSATVALAAEALGVEGSRIAKTLSFHNPKQENSCILVVCAGDVKIDNAKFKERFGFKAKMLSADEALSRTGHAVGGVCPFALPQGVEVYVDSSLYRFDIVYPAAGSSNSAVRLTPDELFSASSASDKVDVCRPIQTETTQGDN